MASIVISGDVSGACTISAPSAAGTPTLTLPTTSGTIAVTGGSPSFSTLTVTGDAFISGLTVGKGAGGAGFSTAFGYQASNSNTTGNNLAIGYQALFSNTTGDSNTAIGRYRTLYSNTTGNNLVAVGEQALFSNTTGSNNTALGFYSLFSNTIGTANVGIGYETLKNSTTATAVTAVGFQAGFSLTTAGGGGNDFFGSAAGYSTTTGNSNVAIGRQSLYSNTTASNNTAVGYQAGYTNTTGNRIVAIGYQAGYSNTNAVANTFVGYVAGNAVTTGIANTFVGDNAGYVATTGASNTFIGQGAGSLVTTGGKNSIIGSYNGNQGGLDIRTSSNNIVLSDGDGNPRLISNGSGEFGIGGAPLSNVGITVNTSTTSGKVAIYGYGQDTSSRSLQGAQLNASYAWHVAALQTTRTANSAFSFLICESDATSTFDKEFILRGDGNAYADGTWNNNGADYAEYFESVTGQAIPVGSTVVLENNKVRIATSSDNPEDVIGVVRPKEPSKASMVVGNTAWNKWANKYLTDDFDRYIMEDHDVVEWTDEDGKFHSYESQNIPANIVVPSNAIRKSHDENGKKFQHYKLNPAWNPDAEYINRENRDEWLIIGLVGQVKVSKGQVMGERWKKMRDVSASVEEWFIR